MAVADGFVLEMERVLAEGDTIPVVPLQAEPGASLARRFRHNAPIVTQLIAVKLDMPQVRARRRAGNAEGIAAYGATGTAIRVARRAPGGSWGA